MPTLRPYQQEDVAATIAALSKHRRVLGRAATGLGKAVVLAALAQHYSQFGRVMVLVDVKKLVRQLAKTIQWFTGITPGIEMGDEQAFNETGYCAADRIVCSTVQTQYSGPEGKERYRRFKSDEFAILLLDETELFLAPKSRSVVDYYLNGNPNLVVFGTTATPLRTDGVTMANLFDAVSFDRDILWGIENGWLVKARQAFVRVSVDFSTLSIRKSDEGEDDYSEEEVASRISNEQTQIELAKGIIHVAETRKSIVVCPTVAVARAVAHYIDAEKPGSARCIYGELGDEEKDDIFGAFDRSEFQILTSVSMLCKGFDCPDIQAVFNCRKTKSKRLYTQILGRGVRPLTGLVDNLETAEQRKAAIASSAKPEAVMVNMVGVEAEVRDITIMDILGEVQDAAIVDRANQLIRDEQMDPDAALEQATEEIEEIQDAEKLLAEAEAESLDDAAEREVRRRVQVEAHVDVEWSAELGSGGGYSDTGHIADRHTEILRKAKLTEGEISRLSPDQAKDLSRRIVMRWKQGLCTFRQAKVLGRFGFDRDSLRTMTRDQAKVEIDAIAANNWKRPVAGAA